MNPIDVVVRCKNEMPHAARTLEALAGQDVETRVLFLDSGSSDGSVAAARRHGARVVEIAPSDYVPGRVLNLGMRLTSSPVVAFVNADAVPRCRDAVRRLASPLAAPRIAASFGRQLARDGAAETTRVDHGRAFGSVAPPPLRVGRFFSMAASAVRRSVWDRLPFDEDLRYSEDVDWTTRLSYLGWGTEYVPDARFEHSHDYDVAGQLRRRRGEGAADTAIHRLGFPSVTRELVVPLLGAVHRDARAGALEPRALCIRSAQAMGFFLGRVEGWWTATQAGAS